MSRSFRRSWSLIAIAVLAAACATKNAAQKVPLGAAPGTDTAGTDAVAAAHASIGPAAKAALDSGNTLFRKKAYAAALAQYRTASDLAPQHSAPLFGIYMVARATNDSAMAGSALAGIRERNGSATPVPHDLTDSGLQRMHANLKRGPSAG